MKIQAGFELLYECPQPTPMIVMLNIHYSRASELLVPDRISTSPAVPMTAYRDGFGNWCTRLVAPAGEFRLAASAVLHDDGQPDAVDTSAHQHRVEDLPEESIVFLLGSRYCETDRLSDVAWSLFDGSPPGWGRVQAICDFVHSHLTFAYESARNTRTAWEAYHERVGVCRDFAHLAVAFCRCMNIPARYCTGYLGDMGLPAQRGPMDFAAWFEAYLGGRWWTFDARNNARRLGRVLIARGRDAADVPISNTFGPNVLKRFVVQCDEIVGAP
ncbi:MAG: transglutaminase family protein [Deltaproteobacteria bacterium]|nr:transglutaminase family protein [Deltaproteobacteria bacterium]